METKSLRTAKNISQIEINHSLSKKNSDMVEDKKIFSSPLIIQAKKDSETFEDYLKQDKFYFSETFSRRKSALTLLNEAIGESENSRSDKPLIDAYKHLSRLVGSAIFNDERYTPLLQKTWSQIKDKVISVTITDILALKTENDELKANFENLETNIFALKIENKDLKTQLNATLEQNKEIKAQNLRLDAIAENNFQVASALKAIFLQLSKDSSNSDIQKTAKVVSRMEIQHEQSILTQQSSLSTNKPKVSGLFSPPKVDKACRILSELTHDESLEGVINAAAIIHKKNSPSK